MNSTKFIKHHFKLYLRNHQPELTVPGQGYPLGSSIYFYPEVKGGKTAINSIKKRWANVASNKKCLRKLTLSGNPHKGVFGSVAPKRARG